MWDKRLLPYLMLAILSGLAVGCAAHPSPELAYWNCIYDKGWLECKPLEVVK